MNAPPTDQPPAPSGYLCLVLHAHLPFVRHPEFPEFIEERWFFEAVRECYLPLLRVLQARPAEGARSRMTLSLSPTLMAMLDDDLLRRRCTRHLERVAQLAERQVRRTEGDAAYHPVARFYQVLSEANLAAWKALGEGGLIDALIAAERAGHIELMTTTATHAFLPIWKRHPDATRRQVQVGLRSFARRIGHAAAGVWLPECGYYPGLEKFLEAEGVRYFFLEAHGLLNGRPRPARGVYAPVRCANGVAAFARDPESSQQVWSARTGYPADYDYREYYRDIGPALPADELQALFPDADLHPATGFKYQRITGPGEQKAPYHPGRASEKAVAHALDFLAKKGKQAAAYRAPGQPPPAIVAPYDAELFGHWWFEGPIFLEALLAAADRSDTLAMITGSDYLDRHPELEPGAPAASSWGARGYHEVWLNDSTAWMYPHLFRAAERGLALPAAAHASLDEAMKRRLLAQAQRELLLAQASDWPFMMNAGRHVAYAEKRVRDHLTRFYWVADALETGRVDEHKLKAIETVDGIFDASLLD